MTRTLFRALLFGWAILPLAGCRVMEAVAEEALGPSVVYAPVPYIQPYVPDYYRWLYDLDRLTEAQLRAYLWQSYLASGKWLVEDPDDLDFEELRRRIQREAMVRKWLAAAGM
jgi:hypothetical protein